MTADSYALEPHVASRLADGAERIVLTGAGGWLGLATIDLLHRALGATLADRIVCLGSSRRTLILRDGTRIEQHPLDTLKDLDRRPTWLLHMAYLTKDRAEDMADDDYVAANRQLAARVFEALDPIGANAIFVPSSGAAYRADDPAASAAMRLYGSLKQADERLFSDWAADRNQASVIARVFNLSGPYINKHDAYALASFIAAALRGMPIKIGATRPVLRSYVAIRELMSLVFALLAGGRGAAPFDTAGEDIVEMRDIADRVKAIVGPECAIERAPLTSTIADTYVGDRTRYAALLAEHRIGSVPFDRQIRETADDMALSIER